MINFVIQRLITKKISIYFIQISQKFFVFILNIHQNIEYISMDYPNFH